MATIYEFRDFAAVRDAADADVHAMAQGIARERWRSMVVERDNGDIYRVTPRGARVKMPAWFMPGTLGGAPS